MARPRHGFGQRPRPPARYRDRTEVPALSRPPQSRMPRRVEAAAALRERMPEAVRLRKRQSVLYSSAGGAAAQRGAGKRGRAGQGGEGRGAGGGPRGTHDGPASPPQVWPRQRRCWRSPWRCGRSIASSFRPASSPTSTGNRWRWRIAWSSNILRLPRPPRPLIAARGPEGTRPPRCHGQGSARVRLSMAVRCWLDQQQTPPAFWPKRTEGLDRDGSGEAFRFSWS